MEVKVKLSDNRIYLSQNNGWTTADYSYIILDDPKEIESLIEKIQEAKNQLAEHRSRLAEENIWES